MRPDAARSVGLLAALLAACDLEDAEADVAEADVAEAASGSAWIEVGAAQFGADGEGERLTIPAQAGVAVAVRATTDPGVCFQLSSLVDGDGLAVIDGRSPGAFCRDCELRTSVAVEAGVFVVAGEPGGLAPEAGLSLRFARVDCQTLTPLTKPGERPTLRLATQTVASAPARASIDLRFLVASDSVLHDDDERQRALMVQLAQELASAGLTPRLVETRELASTPAELRFHAGDPAALAAVLADVPPRAETTIDVVFAGCLLLDDPFFGPPAPVQGFTPRIPGGAGPADGVFLPTRDCFAVGADTLDLPVEAQARVLAHELGHYLGLYHAVETDGLPDPLADTGPDNIMNPNPGLAAAIGFSPAQGRLMRMHPAARPR